MVDWAVELVDDKTVYVSLRIADFGGRERQATADGLIYFEGSFETFACAWILA